VRSFVEILRRVASHETSVEAAEKEFGSPAVLSDLLKRFTTQYEVSFDGFLYGGYFDENGRPHVHLLAKRNPYEPGDITGISTLDAHDLAVRLSSSDDEPDDGAENQDDPSIRLSLVTTGSFAQAGLLGVSRKRVAVGIRLRFVLGDIDSDTLPTE
jgi:hypothetical protein